MGRACRTVPAAIAQVSAALRANDMDSRRGSYQRLWRAGMKAIQIEADGNPTEVVEVVDHPVVGAPAAGEVVLEVEALPINRYDVVLIAGAYGCVRVEPDPDHRLFT